MRGRTMKAVVIVLSIKILSHRNLAVTREILNAKLY